MRVALNTGFTVLAVFWADPIMSLGTRPGTYRTMKMKRVGSMRMWTGFKGSYLTARKRPGAGFVYALA